MGRGRDSTGLLVAVLGTEAIGALSGVVAGGDLARFYDELRKPPGTPTPASGG